MKEIASANIRLLQVRLQFFNALGRNVVDQQNGEMAMAADLSLRIRASGFGLLMLAASQVAPAHAALVISDAPTRNVSCEESKCQAIAPNAVLNRKHLYKVLGANRYGVIVDAGGIAKDLVVDVPLTLLSSKGLGLHASRAIVVRQPIAVIGAGTLDLDAVSGVLTLENGAHVDFWDPGALFYLNGNNYQLVRDVKGLAEAINGNPSGRFALAADYDAAPDGVYRQGAIERFGGTLEGLGHTISNLKFNIDGASSQNGFFVYNGGRIADLNLVRAAGTDEEGLFNPSVGLLVGDNEGTIDHAFVSGRVSHGMLLGGLVGFNGGTITNSHANTDVSVRGLDGEFAGGLAGENTGVIANSYSEGQVVADRDTESPGGLVGWNTGIIKNCYSLASVTQRSADGGYFPFYAGFVGENQGSVIDSYAAGIVHRKHGVGQEAAGFAGFEAQQKGGLDHAYWDLDTGISDPSNGVGNFPNYRGVTGLTTSQLQSGLPKGFNPKVWVQKPGVNNDMPYLISNPPN